MWCDSVSVLDYERFLARMYAVAATEDRRLVATIARGEVPCPACAVCAAAAAARDAARITDSDLLNAALMAAGCDALSDGASACVRCRRVAASARPTVNSLLRVGADRGGLNASMLAPPPALAAGAPVATVSARLLAGA